MMKKRIICAIYLRPIPIYNGRIGTLTIIYKLPKYFSTIERALFSRGLEELGFGITIDMEGGGKYYTFSSAL